MPTASSRTTASRSWSPGPELQALLDATLALARRVPSGRIALARLEEVFGRTHVHEPLDATTVGRAARRFDGFDPDPIAVRAAAQTHRGTADGRPVAIRIRRPGLDRMVRSDLALIDALALPLGAALPNADAAALLRAVREQVLDELDFEHEASMHRRVTRILRDVDGLVVPAVHTDLCTEDLFVADLLDGVGVHGKDVSRVLIAAHVTAARAGFALLDARPGHVIPLTDGRIGLLGVGVARAVDRERAGAAFGSEITLEAAVQGLRSRPSPEPDDLWIARAVGQLAGTLEAASS
jgi:hypothetical protein